MLIKYHPSEQAKADGVYEDIYCTGQHLKETAQGSKLVTDCFNHDIDRINRTITYAS